MNIQPTSVALGVILSAGVLLGTGCKPVNALYKQDTGDLAEVPPPPPAQPAAAGPAPSAQDDAPASANATADLSEPQVIEPLPDPDTTTADAPPPAAPPKPKPMRTYIIKKDDNYWKIAKQEYGDATRMSDIQAANPDVDPKKLQIGDKILLPE